MSRWNANSAIGMTMLVTVTTAAFWNSLALPIALTFTLAMAAVTTDEFSPGGVSRRAVWYSAVALSGAIVITGLAASQPERITTAVAGAVITLVGLRAIHLASPRSIELDHVSYVPLVGATLGWFGLNQVGLGFGVGLMIVAVMVGPLTVLARSRRVPSPLGPALALGGWLTICFGDVIGHWYQAGS